MGYDLHGALAMKEKTAFYQQAITNNWIVCFEHDMDVTAVRLKYSHKGKIEIKEEIKIPTL